MQKHYYNSKGSSTVLLQDNTLIADKDVRPIVKQGAKTRRHLATRNILGDEAAPAPLVFQLM